MVRSEGDRLKRVVVCTPGDEYFGVTDTGAHHIDVVADRYEALRQHGALRKALEATGCRVIDLPELPGHPNSVFTRDTSVCTPSGYVRVRMGLPSRRGEEEWIAACLESLGLRCAGSIEEPATVEGGDVILAGEVAFIGRSARTNEAGAAAMAAILAREGFEVRRTNVPEPFLHIGGAMSVIGGGLILACSGVFPRGFFEGFDEIEIECDEFASGNVISLGGGSVIADSANGGACAALELSGVIVHRRDLSEFTKGHGGPSCLILPIERVPDR